MCEMIGRIGFTSLIILILDVIKIYVKVLIFCLNRDNLSKKLLTKKLLIFMLKSIVIPLQLQDKNERKVEKSGVIPNLFRDPLLIGWGAEINSA
jgi:hypothetical protein